jgi:uncharacterized protein (DUF58 family)
MIIFTDEIEKFIPPAKGARHVLRIIREALYCTPKGKKTDISKALEYLNRVCKRSTVSFIISDFYDEGFSARLSIANKRHDVVSVTITDPKELDMPDIGMAVFTDPETQKDFNVDTSDPSFRQAYRQNALRILDERKKNFDRIGIDNVDIRCDVAFDRTLFKFFRMRERRLR